MKKLENQLSNYFGYDLENKILRVDRAFIGLFALFMTLKKKSRKNKVLFTSNTCASPVYACLYAGLIPEFTDISLSNFLMDENETRYKICTHGEDILAIVYIYTFGFSSNFIYELKTLSKQKGIILIEDVAQAFGCKAGDQITGTIGDFSVFSFGYSKQIDAGCGGLVINNSGDNIYKELLEILSSTTLYSPNKNLSDNYSKLFYSLRLKAIEDEKNYRLYSSFYEKFKPLYFIKYTPDWNLIENKTDYFIQTSQQLIRNNVAKEYQNEFRKDCTAEKIFFPLVKDYYSVYRYTFLAKDKNDASALSKKLRDEDINCSNLYIPVSRFFYDKGFENSVDFAKRCINLWVEPSIVNKAYIKKTVRILKDHYNTV